MNLNMNYITILYSLKITHRNIFCLDFSFTQFFICTILCLHDSSSVNSLLVLFFDCIFLRLDKQFFTHKILVTFFTLIQNFFYTIHCQHDSSSRQSLPDFLSRHIFQPCTILRLFVVFCKYYLLCTHSTFLALPKNLFIRIHFSKDNLFFY